MRIGLMTSGDAGEVAKLLNHAIEKGVAHFATEPTDAGQVLSEWRAAGELYPWLVARDDAGEFLGFARGSAWHPRHAYLWTVATAIYLVPAARSRGIGGRLYTVLFEMLERQGFKGALGGVSLPNPASERLHERMGMSVMGEIRPGGYKKDRWVPVRWYQKTLGRFDERTPPSDIRPVTEVWSEMERTPA